MAVYREGQAFFSFHTPNLFSVSFGDISLPNPVAQGKDMSNKRDEGFYDLKRTSLFVITDLDGSKNDETPCLW